MVKTGNRLVGVSIIYKTKNPTKKYMQENVDCNINEKYKIKLSREI
jgi:hypothetical protein